MTSKLVLDNLAGRTTAGSIAVVGEGNGTTTNLQQGLAKQWAFYNQQTPAVGDSFNTGSITDNSTGDYTVNLTNAMSSTNYSATGTSIDIGSYYLATTGRVTFSTSSYELNCCDSGFNVRDPDDASNISFGDLA
jgi:hypothetical protein